MCTNRTGISQVTLYAVSIVTNYLEIVHTGCLRCAQHLQASPCVLINHVNEAELGPLSDPVRLWRLDGTVSSVLAYDELEMFEDRPEVAEEATLLELWLPEKVDTESKRLSSCSGILSLCKLSLLLYIFLKPLRPISKYVNWNHLQFPPASFPAE